jgi:hypothetical protein
MTERVQAAKLDSAAKICDYATEVISAMGLPKEEWIDVFLDAENIFIAEHDIEFDEDPEEDPEGRGPVKLPISPQPFNAESVVRVVRVESAEGCKEALKTSPLAD